MEAKSGTTAVSGAKIAIGVPSTGVAIELSLIPGLAAMSVILVGARTHIGTATILATTSNARVVD